MMENENKEFIGTWGEFGYKNEVHPEDKEMIDLLERKDTYGLLFRCIGQIDDYLVLKYGDVEFRGKSESYNPIPQKPDIEVGDWVSVKSNPSKKGIIYEIQWHGSRQSPVFMMRVNGTRKSTNWYSEDELEKLTK